MNSSMAALLEDLGPLGLANKITKALYPDLYGKPGVTPEQVFLVMGCRGVVLETIESLIAEMAEAGKK